MALGLVSINHCIIHNCSIDIQNVVEYIFVSTFTIGTSLSHKICNIVGKPRMFFTYPSLDITPSQGASAKQQQLRPSYGSIR